MTGMPDRGGASEPKRRLSLRLHSADKRIKGDSHRDRGRSGSRSRDDSINDDAPSTSASSSNRHVVPLMGQSAGSSETDDGSEWRGGSRRRSPRVPPPAASGSRRWDDAREYSPPPSMTLSTGQPLVNPPLKTQAAFVGKLYSMLEDDEIGKTGLLHWAPGGHTFICPNPTEFSKAILPRFFKHNNWQSFVRQLNMYSFNKVNDLYATSSDPLAWEFRHPLFRQGEPHLLASIKRKSTRPSAHDGQPVVSPSEEISEARALSGWARERERDVPLPHPSMHPQVQLQLQAQAQAQYQRESATPRQVYGYNAVTGEMIEARPYEQTARASTREFCETLRRPDDGALVRRDRSERAPQSRPPTYNDAAYYPQPISAPSPHSPPRSAVPQLQAEVARLRDALTQQRMQGAQRDIEAAQYALWLLDWVPGADSRDVFLLRQELGRRESQARQELDTITPDTRPDTRRPESDSYSTYPTAYTAPSPVYDSHSRPPTEHRSRAILPPPSSARRDLGFGPLPEPTPTQHPLPNVGPDRQRLPLPLPLPRPSEYRRAHTFEPAPLLLPDSMPSVPPSQIAQPPQLTQLAQPAQPAKGGPPVARAAAAAVWDGAEMDGQAGQDAGVAGVAGAAEWSSRGQGRSVDGDADMEDDKSPATNATNVRGPAGMRNLLN